MANGFKAEQFSRASVRTDSHPPFVSRNCGDFGEMAFGALRFKKLSEFIFLRLCSGFVRSSVG
jgi:hypothetical protein